MDLERCFFTVSLAMPVAVLLSQWTGVGGCLWPSSASTSLKMTPSLLFMNRAPNSASAADATTILRMPQSVKMAPFSVIGWLSAGVDPRKKYPAIRLLAFVSDKYDASE